MRTVFFDVDTQIDFALPAGALYAPGAERILPALAALQRCAQARRIPVISTVDAHAEDDPEFRIWPPHCVAGTLGQHKLPGTLLDRRVVIPNRAADFDMAGAYQFILEKQSTDSLTNVNLPRLLEFLRADRYIVYGLVTEYCVRSAAMGLLKTGKRVEMAADAICSLRDEDAARTFAEFTAAGVRLTTVAAVCA